ncbi:ABC transporter permease subunit [Flavisolibacter nicotianae]|uniref:ABC transporter permease subunit n=1 Tax=Flavisolibacter nicotianae TaxID=2364882 RepID=UPI000EB3D6D2|nr:ABC transporter permease subunit [Flavisolibacter nicotianae]
MLKISKYVLYDILRNRVVLAYTAFLLLVSLSLFQMEENSSKAVLSLLNIVLIVVPLVSMVFSTIHWYNSYEFIELMLTQPVSRKKVLLSEFAGIGSSLVTAYLVGVGIPVVLYNFDSTGIALLLIGSLLTLVFTSIAFFASIKSRDKARGIGAALLLWFFFALIFDGLLLVILFAFSDYPLEKVIMVLSSFNPIDLGRIYLMLQMDVSALMGYTGATYKDFFGSSAGMIYTFGTLLLWMIVPLLLSLRSFSKKDL